MTVEVPELEPDVGPEAENSDPQSADQEDSKALYDLIEKQIAPLYYERKNGIPTRWVARMREAISGKAACDGARISLRSSGLRPRYG